MRQATAGNVGREFHRTFPSRTGLDRFTGSDQRPSSGNADFWIVHGIVTEDTTQGNCQLFDRWSTVRLSRAVLPGRSDVLLLRPAPARCQSGIQKGQNAL